VKLTIRARLTLLYVVVLAGSFVGFFWICDIGFQRSIETTVSDASRTNLDIVRVVIDDTAAKGSEKLGDELTELSALWANGAIFEVAGPDGRWIVRSPKLISPQPPLAPYIGADVVFDTTNLEAQQYRIARQRVNIRGSEFMITSAVPTEPFDQALDNFRLTEKKFLPLLVVIASLLGYWLSGRALSPVSQITKSAARIGVRNLSQRLEVPRAQDELRHLTETLNAMLGRIESSVNRTRQFTADASHDLRTPLALIRTNAELALRRPRTDVEYRETLSRILNTSEETTQLIEKLLTLARADAGVATLHFVAMDAVPCLRKVAAEARVLATDKSIHLTEEFAAEPAHVLADTEALERMLISLLDNAVKYTPENGDVWLRCYVENDILVVEVQDSGVGIAEADLPNIFERFYRADQSRTRRVGGAGLGLSIAKWIAEAHRGSIQAFSRPSGGSLFRVNLPLLKDHVSQDVLAQNVQHSPASAD
jgi:two-component system heavy metal sensor histidine kinase CusS